MADRAFRPFPYFYGHVYRKVGDSPQDYLAWHEDYRIQHPRPDQAADVSAFVAGFKEEAKEWWDKEVLKGTKYYDTQRARTDRDYMHELFKKRYFPVQEQEDTASDLTGLKQLPNQPTHHYLFKLQQQLNTQAEFQAEHALRAIRAEKTDEMVVPEDLRAAVAAIPAANRDNAVVGPLTYNQLSQRILTAVATARQEAVTFAAQEATFDKLVAHAMRTVTNPKMREFIHKKYTTVDKNLGTLADLVQKEERSYKLPTPAQTHNSGVSELGYDEEEEDDDEDVEYTVNAFGQQIARKKKKHQQRGGKRCGRGGQPGQQRGRGGKPAFLSAPPEGAKKWYPTCQSQNHDFAECRRTQRLCQQFQTLGGRGGGHQQQQRGGRGGARGGGRGGGRGGARGGFDNGGYRGEPMDTSAASAAQAQYQLPPPPPQQQQYHQQPYQPQSASYYQQQFQQDPQVTSFYGASPASN